MTSLLGPTLVASTVQMSGMTEGQCTGSHLHWALQGPWPTLSDDWMTGQTPQTPSLHLVG